LSDGTPTDSPPRFGLATAAFVVVSSMIGTGVLTTSGFTTYFVGSNQLMLLLWVVGGVVAACGALSVAELSSAMPESGGDYVYLREAYGAPVAFLSGWVSFLIGFGGPIALSASAAAKYLLAPLGLGESGPTAERLVATAAIVALALVHALSHGSARVQGATTVVKVTILALLGLAGIAAGWGRWSNLADPVAIDGPRLLAMGSSLVYISYAYTGWNAAGYLAGEVRDAQRNLPRAVVLGTALVLAIYLAINLFFALALTAADVRAIVDDPANTRGPEVVAPIAEIAAGRLFGSGVRGVLSVGIGLTMLASLSAFVLTGPRVVQAMARSGHFPAPAARLHPRFGTPVTATAMQVAWSLVLLWTGSFDQLLQYSGVGLALFSMLTVSAIYVLRWKRPGMPRPFRTPGYPVVPAVFLVVTGLLTYAAFRQRPQESGLALLSILVGLPLHAAGAWWARRKAAVSRG
jgi:APA family basic amino acid/polyamine antiporter